jgi:hypothetical protein
MKKVTYEDLMAAKDKVKAKEKKLPHPEGRTASLARLRKVGSFSKNMDAVGKRILENGKDLDKKDRLYLEWKDEYEKYKSKCLEYYLGLLQ